METIKLHGCLAIYAVVCTLGTIFVSVVINETKGKNLDSIGNENEKIAENSAA